MVECLALDDLAVYGRLDEITALDFLRVQLDTTYRRRWDPSAAQLEVVDEDEESATDIVYWETHWPVLIDRPHGLLMCLDMKRTWSTRCVNTTKQNLFFKKSQ